MNSPCAVTLLGTRPEQSMYRQESFAHCASFGIPLRLVRSDEGFTLLEISLFICRVVEQDR